MQAHAAKTFERKEENQHLPCESAANAAHQRMISFFPPRSLSHSKTVFQYCTRLTRFLRTLRPKLLGSTSILNNGSRELPVPFGVVKLQCERATGSIGTVPVCCQGDNNWFTRTGVAQRQRAGLITPRSLDGSKRVAGTQSGELVFNDF